MATNTVNRQPPPPSTYDSGSDDADNASVQAVARQAANQTSQVQGQINEGNQALAGLTANLSSFTSQVQVQTTLLDSVNSQIATLSRQRGQSGLSDQQKNAIDGKIQALGQQGQYLQSEIDSLKAQVDGLKSQINSQQSQIDGLRNSALPRAQASDQQAQTQADNDRAAADQQKASDASSGDASQTQQKPPPGPLDIDYSAELLNKPQS